MESDTWLNGFRFDYVSIMSMLGQMLLIFRDTEKDTIEL